MIVYLTVDEVIEIHDRLVSAPIINRGLLESAVALPADGYGDFEYYPTVLEKAAALLRGLGSNHAFLDGNKRTCWTATQVFLDKNGFQIVLDCDEEGASFVESVVKETWEISQIAEWLADHLA